MKIRYIIAGTIVGAVVGALMLYLAALKSALDVLLPALILSIVIGGGLGVGLVFFLKRRYDIDKSSLERLPGDVADFVMLIIGNMRYRKKVRSDVMAELIDHFEDELHGCNSDEERLEKAKQLIADFGDVKMLGKLLRRAKKRCRPLWRTVIARTFYTVFIIFISFFIYLVWFFTGKPVVTTNYVAEFNRIARPVADESLNAAPAYQKAAQIYEQLSEERRKLPGIKYDEATEQEKQAIKNYLEEQKETLAFVVEGSKKPYYWREYNTGDDATDEAIAVLLPYLSGYRGIAKSLRWRALLNAEQGQYERAFEDMLVCYRFGRHLKGDKTLVEQLVGIAIEALSARTIREILYKYEVDAAALEKLQDGFERAIAGEDFVISVEAEKIMLYDEIQRCFTDDRFGGGHLYVKRLQTLAALTSGDGPSSLLELVIGQETWTVPMQVLFTHPNKQQTREMGDRFYDYLSKMSHKSPGQMRAEGIDLNKEATRYTKGNIFLGMLTPAIGRIIELSHRVRIDLEASVTIIALFRYKQQHGDYPDSLGRLVETSFLKSVPVDVFSDRPIVYRKTDGDFILYSVGENFVDYGGQVYINQKGRANPWGADAGGDAVFWPVPRDEMRKE
ncbi:hypothetical protein ACFL3G_10785 [Planctomycetota bacterium]